MRGIICPPLEESSLKGPLGQEFLAVSLFEDVLLSGGDKESANGEVRIPKCSQFDTRIRHSTFAPFVLEQLLQQLGGDVLVL